MSAEAPRLAVPRVRRKAGAFPCPPRSVRSGRERPLLAAWPRSERLRFPGTNAFAVRRSGQAPIAFLLGHAAIERRTPRSCRTLFANLKIEANPDPSARRIFDEKRTPRLDPFCSLGPKQAPILPPPDLGAKQAPTSIRLQPGLKANLDPSAAGPRDEKRTPRPRSFAAPARSKPRFLATGPSTEARTLQHPARSRHRPEANLLPFAARSSAREQALQPRPFAARAGASPGPDRRTA